MIHSWPMFDDTASGIMKCVIFMQDGRFRLTYLAIDKCLETRPKIDGDILVRVLTVAFSDDFFPFETPQARYEFIMFYVGQLLALGLFGREGKYGKILSFNRDVTEIADLRRESKEAVGKYLNQMTADEWLHEVARLYSEGEEHEAMHDKKESTLN